MISREVNIEPKLSGLFLLMHPSHPPTQSWKAILTATANLSSFPENSFSFNSFLAAKTVLDLKMFLEKPSLHVGLEDPLEEGLLCPGFPFPGLL